eukprot:38457-Chlamydomonas_euryale.AAC.11
MQIMLSKLRGGPVAPEDIPANIHVSSVSHTPLASLYHSIKSVYGPMLDTGRNGDQHAAACLRPQSGTTIDPKLAELLQQLQAGLGSAVRKGANLQVRPFARPRAARRDRRTVACAVRRRMPTIACAPCRVPCAAAGP